MLNIHNDVRNCHNNNEDDDNKQDKKILTEIIQITNYQ